MPCKQCNKKVANSDRIVCRGFCGAYFHVICAKVDTPLHDQLVINEKNVFWMCNECAVLFSNGHFRNIVGRYDDANADVIQSMKVDIAKLHTAVAALSEKVTPSTPAWPHQERPLLGAKRRLQSTSNPKPNLPQSLQGKKVLSAPVPVIPNNPPIDKCWIWLASFPPRVTEADICAMVKECLSCDDDDFIEARALIKKGVDIASLRSVNFKVGVDKKYRQTSLDVNTWPEGVSFREFIDFGSGANPENSGSGFAKTPRLMSPRE